MLDHRAKWHKRVVNELLRGVDGINELKTGFTTGPVSDNIIYHEISTLVTYFEDDVVCNLGFPGGRWEIPQAQSPRSFVLTANMIKGAYQLAAELRATDPTTWDGLTGADFLTDASSNTNNYLSDGAVASGYVYGDKLRAEDPGAVEATAANWPYRNGYCGSDPFTNFPGLGGGPGHAYGKMLGADYVWYPAIVPTITQNAVTAGSLDVPIFPEGAAEYRAAIEGISASINPAFFLQACPTGTVLHSARCLAFCEGISRQKYVRERTSADPGGAITDTITTEPLTGMSILLLRGFAMRGYMRWEPAGAGFDIPFTNGKLKMIDVLGPCNRMLEIRDAGDGTVTYSMIPALPSTAIGNGAGDLLKGMLVAPTISFDGPRNRCYTAKTERSTMLWDSFALGDLVIEFTLPSGEFGRALVPFGNWPSFI